MPLLGRIFAGDEELGKKDDDHKLKRGRLFPSSWKSRHPMLAVRRRRLSYGVVSLLLVYLFIQIVPLNLGSHPRPWASSGPGDVQAGFQEAAPTGQPPRPRVFSQVDEHYYEGRVKFYNLAVSLYAVKSFGGHNRVNRHVMFAASDLKSASEIIPLACEMAGWKWNEVHFALMGRDDLDVSVVKSLNGISDEDCSISWHDARPDYSRWSSDLRMELSVAAAMGHIQTFIEPQVIITNHGSREDGFFIKSIRAKASEIGKSLIELPLDATENLMWLTRLDSGSLAAWQTVYVDLVIHAPPKSSGSLIRLLKSIEAADYFGSRRPHLTIELPAEIDRPTLEFLENLVWPPLDGSGGSHASQVTLRHRLPRYGFTAEEASTHFIESFYPARPKDSHVLLISPQVELSPMYYHYVMYNLLRYKYAAYARLTDASKSLMGFSLELPSVYLNGSAGLQPPILEPLSNGLEFVPQERTPFLWQAPNSNAALYFGDKWVELHSFLSARNSIRDPQFPKDYKPPSRNKIVSEHYPSWMEYVQELMRARGYSLLYPYIPARSHAVVTVHNELFQLPEEYSPARHRSSLNPTPSLNAHGPFIVNSSSISPGLTVHEESPLLTSNLLTWLSESGRSSLPDLISLPILSYDGNLTSPSLSESNAEAFANDFRREIGRCGANEPLAHNHMSAEDLFCYPKLREYGLIDPMEEEDNDKGISTGTVVGNPMEIPSEQVQEEAKMLATEGENVQREVADAVKLGKDDVQTEASKLMQKSGQDIVAEGSKADLRLATGGKIETLDNKITSKDANLKMDEHIIKEDSINDGSIDFKLAINDDEKSAKKEAVEAMTTRVNQPAIKQDAAGDLDLQGLQAGLDSTKGTSTELSPAQNRPSASITVDTAFVRPAVRHRGW